ncbi:hypothetical protein NQU47_19680 [Pseudoalteromonas distincta]|uniref:hypothetical protein n=1 Tax=Pseudoalteromonas distincta TaxID=77608 RepID=UPI002340CE69|nr:hypothetical protein [Pseudoalteromonas distincta]MDC3214786.1 hypothetical protein [Pseudoalteromonas distincta]
MDSIVEKAGAVFPFPDPKPVHFPNNKGEYSQDTATTFGGSMLYVVNPFEPGSYIYQAANNGNLTYYNSQNQVVWSLSFYPALNEIVTKGVFFFFQSGGKDYVLIPSEYNDSFSRILKIDLSDGTLDKSGQRLTGVTITKFFMSEGELCIRYSDGTLRYAAINRETLEIGQAQLMSSRPDSNIVLDGKVGFYSLSVETENTGNVGGSAAVGLIMRVEVKSNSIRFIKHIRIPFYSSVLPMHGGRIYLISDDIYSIGIEEGNNAEAASGQRYWDRESLDTWIKNVIEHYTGVVL